MTDTGILNKAVKSTTLLRHSETMPDIHEMQHLENEFYKVERVENLSGIETQEQLAFPIDGPRCDGYLFRVTLPGRPPKIHLFETGSGGNSALFEMPDKKSFCLMAGDIAHIMDSREMAMNEVIDMIKSYRFSPSGLSLVITDYSNIYIWSSDSSPFCIRDGDGHCFTVDCIDNKTVTCTSDDCGTGPVTLVIELASGKILKKSF